MVRPTSANTHGVRVCGCAVLDGDAVTHQQPFAPLEAAGQPLSVDRCWQLWGEGCQAGPPSTQQASVMTERQGSFIIVFYFMGSYFKLLHFTAG